MVSGVKKIVVVLCALLVSQIPFNPAAEVTLPINSVGYLNLNPVMLDLRGIVRFVLYTLKVIVKRILNVRATISCFLCHLGQLHGPVTLINLLFDKVRNSVFIDGLLVRLVSTPDSLPSVSG